MSYDYKYANFTDTLRLLYLISKVLFNICIHILKHNNISV